MKSYWDRRAEADMDRVQAQAERRLSIINQAMDDAQAYLTEEARRILKRYRTKYGLTEEEAKAELQKPITETEYKRLAARLIALPEGEEKQLLTAQANRGAYAHRISRVEALRENIAIEAAKIARVVEDETEKQRKDTAEEAYGHRLFTVQQQTGDLFAVPDLDTFQVATHSPWFGGNYSATVWGKNQKDLAEALEKKITAGYLSGKSYSKIAQEIKEQFGVSFRTAERLVRTETSYVSNQADLAAYKRSGVKWYRFVATLDTRTCDDCGPMDLVVYEVEKAQVQVNFPPMHPWCRCTTVAVWDRDKPMDGTRFARDSANKGISVPKSMNYAEWKEWQKAGGPEDVEEWIANHRKSRPAASQTKE